MLKRAPRLAVLFALLILVPGLAFAQPKEKVTISALPFISTAPIFIAKERGYFDAEGIDLDIKIFNAAQAVAVAVASGDADFGITAFTGGFFNLAGKGALKVIAAQSREEPGYNFVAYVASKKAYDAGFRSPKDFAGKSYCADLKVTPDGRFLYGTNRGHDSIAAYRIDEEGRLTLIGIEPSLGKGPQNLAITPGGELLLCANMAGGNVARFGIDPASGRLASMGDPLPLRSPSCIRVVP